MAIDISPRGIALLKEFEGAYTKLSDGRYKSYLDKLAVPPVWTIFTGLTKGVTAETCWTEEECEARLKKELNVCEATVERLVTVPLNRNQADALIDFVFNVGDHAFETSTLLKVLNQGKYEQVPIQLMRWTHAGGVEYAGLVRRRKAEGALFMEPMPDSAPSPQEALEGPQMPQRVEEKPASSKIQTAKTSHTIRSLVVAAGAYIADKAIGAYDTIFGIAKDAGGQVLSLKTTISPLDPLLKVGLPTIVIIAIVYAIMRRFAAGTEGKIG